MILKALKVILYHIKHLYMLYALRHHSISETKHLLSVGAMIVIMYYVTQDFRFVLQTLLSLLYGGIKHHEF